jgi:hypothetical protein
MNDTKFTGTLGGPPPPPIIPSPSDALAHPTAWFSRGEDGWAIAGYHPAPARGQIIGVRTKSGEVRLVKIRKVEQNYDSIRGPFDPHWLAKFSSV